MENRTNVEMNKKCFIVKVFEVNKCLMKYIYSCYKANYLNRNNCRYICIFHDKSMQGKFIFFSLIATQLLINILKNKQGGGF